MKEHEAWWVPQRGALIVYSWSPDVFWHTTEQHIPMSSDNPDEALERAGFRRVEEWRPAAECLLAIVERIDA